MEYLFFDIECCDGQHMCEFGYVLADENFEPIAQECLLINPLKEFRLTGRRKSKDLTLHFSENEYKNSPQFDFYYDKIRQLLTRSGQTVIGFSAPSDVKFLNIACQRYGKADIKFAYVDSQQLFKTLFSGKITSLENAAAQLQIPIDVTLHKSDDDALLTLNLVKGMCKEEGVSFDKLCELYKRQSAQKSHVEKRSFTFGELLGGVLGLGGFDDGSTDVQIDAATDNSTNMSTADAIAIANPADSTTADTADFAATNKSTDVVADVTATDNPIDEAAVNVYDDRPI